MFELECKRDSIVMLNQTSPDNIQQEYTIQEALLQDKIFLKFGIEKEEYSRAIDKHKLKDDLSVQMQLDEINSMINEELKEKIVDQLFPQDESCYGSERSYLDSYRDEECS